MRVGVQRWGRRGRRDSAESDANCCHCKVPAKGGQHARQYVSVLACARTRPAAAVAVAGSRASEMASVRRMRAASDAPPLPPSDDHDLDEFYAAYPPIDGSAERKVMDERELALVQRVLEKVVAAAPPAWSDEMEAAWSAGGGAGAKGKRASSQSRRSSGGAPKCTRCSQPFGALDTVFTAGKERLHPGCVSCSHCGAVPNGKDANFVMVNGKLLCPESLRALFKKDCRGCGKDADVRDLLVQVDNDVWHADCFQCSVCADVLHHVEPGASSGFRSQFAFDAKGQLCCPEHAATHTCGGCRLKVKAGEKAVSARVHGEGAEPSVFHEACLCCHECRKPLATIGGGFVPHGGRLYCKPDFVKLHNLQCAACEGEIELGASFFETGASKYHDKCYKCRDCGKREGGLVAHKGGLSCVSCRRR